MVQTGPKIPWQDESSVMTTEEIALTAPTVSRIMIRKSYLWILAFQCVIVYRIYCGKRERIKKDWKAGQRSFTVQKRPY